MPNPLSRYSAAFRHRDYRLLVSAFFIDSIGSWASGVVVDVYVFTTTHSLAWLAAMACASWIPGLLAAPIGGVLADRYDRRTIMIVSAVLSAVVATVATIVVGVGAPVIFLLLLNIAGAIARSPYRPAAGALTPNIVDEKALPAANGLFAGLENLVIVIGPAIGGLLLLLNDPVIGLALNAASYFAAALLASFLAVRSRGDAAAGEGVLRQVAQGMQALGATPTAAVLLLFCAIDTLLAGAYTVLYIPISQHTGMGTNGYGYLLTGAAIGGIIGAFVAERVSASKRFAPIMVAGVALQALPYAVTPLTDVAAVGIGLQVVSGIGMVLVDVLALTAIQREVAAGRLSRVLSLLDTTVLAASVLGSVGAAALLSAVPYEVSLLGLGLGCTVLAFALSPLLVRSDRKAAATAELFDARVQVLARIPLFADLGRPLQERLAAAARPEEVAAGAVLIREGDPADALWVLVEGRLAITTTATPGGVRPNIPDVTPPDVVGEIGVLRGIPRTATAAATEPSTVWRLDVDDYLASIEPARLPLFMVGQATARLTRTHPQLVAAGAPLDPPVT